jgi:hypothetical protein
VAGFLDLAFSFPTVVYTTALAVMLGYWLLVLVGVFGFDLGTDLGSDGALDAKTGALEAKGAALDAKGGVLEALGFGVIPGTVVLSILVFWSWVLSMLGSLTLGPALGGLLPLWASGLTLLLMAGFLSALLSMASVKPLRPLFTIVVAPTRRQLLGKVATVASGTVNARHGQASLEDGGAGLLLQVYCPKQNQLKKGDRVLLLEYDDKLEAYEVEPVEWLLPEELVQLDNPLTAELLARAHLDRRLG